MRLEVVSSISLATLLGVSAGLRVFATPQAHDHDKPSPAAALQIPSSLQAEHDAIHAALDKATRAPGRIGATARQLASVLHPHFVREQEIALPPLGLLAALARGETPPDPATVLTMTESLRKELPQMLQEHQRIRAALEDFRVAAEAEKSADAQRLAEELGLHALTEEQVLYPAAVLVGDVIRLRTGGPK